MFHAHGVADCLRFTGALELHRHRSPVAFARSIECDQSGSLQWRPGVWHRPRRGVSASASARAGRVGHRLGDSLRRRSVARRSPHSARRSLPVSLVFPRGPRLHDRRVGSRGPCRAGNRAGIAGRPARDRGLGGRLHSRPCGSCGRRRGIRRAERNAGPGNASGRGRPPRPDHRRALCARNRNLYAALGSFPRQIVNSLIGVLVRDGKLRTDDARRHLNGAARTTFAVRSRSTSFCG